MNKPVSLDDIVRELEFQIEGYSSYLNLHTGELFMISYDDFRSAEEDKDIASFPLWQQEQIRLAREIMEEEYFVPLPTKYDIHEYGMIKEFCASIKDDRLKEIMSASIKGGGAYRRFYDNIRRYGIADDWYAYRYLELKKIAIAWCKKHALDYVE